MERDGDPRGSVLPGIPRRTASAAPSQNLNVGYIGYISPVVTGRSDNRLWSAKRDCAREGTGASTFHCLRPLFRDSGQGVTASNQLVIIITSQKITTGFRPFIMKSMSIGVHSLFIGSILPYQLAPFVLQSRRRFMKPGFAQEREALPVSLTEGGRNVFEP